MTEPTFLGRDDEESSLSDADLHTDGGETVGRSDVAADAARSGVDVDSDELDQRAGDGVPVGADDVEADRRRSGADPETV